MAAHKYTKKNFSFKYFKGLSTFSKQNCQKSMYIFNFLKILTCNKGKKRPLFGLLTQQNCSWIQWEHMVHWSQFTITKEVWFFNEGGAIFFFTNTIWYILTLIHCQYFHQVSHKNLDGPDVGDHGLDGVINLPLLLFLQSGPSSNSKVKAFSQISGRTMLHFRGEAYFFWILVCRLFNVPWDVHSPFQYRNRQRRARGYMWFYND